jgi:uncharacterized protein
MIVRPFDNLADFHMVAMPKLMQAEVENCILISFGDDPATRGYAVYDGDEPIAFAIHTPGRNAFLSPGNVQAAEMFALHAISWRELTGIAGPVELTHAFCAVYQRETSRMPKLHCALVSHRLDHVIPPRRIEGELSPMRIADADIVVPFFRDFSIAVGEPDNDPAKSFRARVERQRGFVWRVDGKAVSMANWAGPTPNGVRINLVYTPTQNRNRGYASALVAALSQHLLDSGRKFCFLYTDLSNPISNSIYRKIGYNRVGEAEHYMFSKNP